MAQAGSRRAAPGAKRRTPASGSKGSGIAGTAGSKRTKKFNANGEHVNGVWCASEAEAERYRQLLRMEMDGRIDNLRTQVVFKLEVQGKLIATYRADFCYDVIDERGNPLRSVTEDVKGYFTPDFEIKHKLFDALFFPPLSIIHAKGQIKGSRALWLAEHWADRLPE